MPPDSRSFPCLSLVDLLRRAPVVVGMGVFAVILFLPGWLNDPDTYWHVVTGRWIVTHRAVPMVDIFSWTMSGHPWVAHEWLSELLMALAYMAGGWSGVMILMSVATALTVALLVQPVERVFGLIGITMVLACGMMPIAPDLVARPHILSLPCLMVWLNALIRARSQDKAPSLFWLPVITLWANLHGGFVLGLALAGFFALEALVETSADRRLTVLRDWAIFGLGSVAAAAINPHGVDGLLFPFRLMRLKTLNSIVEWGASTLDNGVFIGLLIVVALYLVVFRQLRMSWLRALLLILLAWNAYLHVRNQMLMGLIGTAIVTEAMAARYRQGAAEDRIRLVYRWAPPLLAVLAFSLAILRIEKPLPHLGPEITPEKAVDKLPPSVAAQPGFNEYGFGGYLIFRGVRPFIDGRLDMYGDALMTQYLTLNKGGAPLTEYLAGSPVKWALVRAKTGAAATLAHLPGWKPLYADKVAELYVRE